MQAKKKDGDEEVDGDVGNSEEEKKKVVKGRGRKKATSESQSAGDANGSTNDDGKSQMAKVLLKGAAAVDPECSELVGIAHVYTEFDDIYDALLNQSDQRNGEHLFRSMRKGDHQCPVILLQSLTYS
ncbi:unnamed protein product [Gongylonema pulchrum]|uniref:Uncharacterized protein n=1 Tax=Gongylonema pulchrum TaxID=637853 RepID=A0A3P6QKS3_9BILA|nr:unnamed protein product [Gongylonema pulchrum]